jgi:hypothetical protein
MDAAGGEESFWQQGRRVKWPWVELALKGRHISLAQSREKVATITDLFCLYMAHSTAMLVT